MHIITKKKKEEDIITLNDLPETKEFVKMSRIWITLFGVIPKALISNVSTFAYLFMILSMCWNAGFISILYPLAVFGYALMEEARPSKYFWIAVTFYTVLIILIKTLFQLDIWFYINSSLYQFSNPEKKIDPEQPFDTTAFPFTYNDLNVILYLKFNIFIELLPFRLEACRRYYRYVLIHIAGISSAYLCDDPAILRDFARCAPD